MKTKMLFAFLLIGIVEFTSCSKEKADPNEGELITTVRVKLTEKVLGGTGALTVFEFKDLDGEGGAAPSKFDEITLQKGKIYDCVLEILNESVSPADNITAEIIAEAKDHQFYFSATNGLVSFSNFSADGKGFPLGTTSLWTASSNTGSGTLNITLKHKPGVKTANDNVSVGETDISLDFKLKVL
ncbi:MAG: hypothetical protein RLZZ294_1629 [Bacteroidota bacterium]